jgi:hypothetical protein
LDTAFRQGQIGRSSGHDHRGIADAEQVAAIGFEYRVMLAADHHDIAVARQQTRAVIERRVAAQRNLAVVLEKQGRTLFDPRPRPRIQRTIRDQPRIFSDESRC